MRHSLSVFPRSIRFKLELSETDGSAPPPGAAAAPNVATEPPPAPLPTTEPVSTGGVDEPASSPPAVAPTEPASSAPAPTPRAFTAGFRTNAPYARSGGGPWFLTDLSDTTRAAFHPDSDTLVVGPKEFMNNVFRDDGPLPIGSADAVALRFDEVLAALRAS